MNWKWERRGGIIKNVESRTEGYQVNVIVTLAKPSTSKAFHPYPVPSPHRWLMMKSPLSVAVYKSFPIILMMKKLANV